MKFTKKLLGQMLASASAVIEENAAMLNSLDAATGDGDHGTAINAAIKAAAAAAQKDGNLANTLQAIGWDVMSSTSGSTSTLTGSFFLGMANAAQSDELNVQETITLFEAGLANVRLSTKATVGDKTLMDSLIPAIEAMNTIKKSENLNNTSLADLFQAAATAAQKGADTTKDLLARYGRAKNIGERSKGNLDAGAVSTALIYKAYANTILNESQKN
ncbi:MAG: DAK2 domain-containing protein [Planctomycetaceae bacterium]|jgi:dihydroxyacetone kinase-like protein|nr:DAK2 domain-containing protein [Planctomycetaceae bacterium]